ncbi:hypothetical protein RFF05_18175 [Bengtsoniella intestinalis]|uniref:hypothetical protein n=1 Tax=Bengtsoniella intestinalis TaxID=3073143 RepID=UPI00391F96DD
MTFESVLAEFKDYLEADTICEVVNTSRGYTVLLWEEKLKQWYGVELCPTPQDLRQVLQTNCNEFETIEKRY